MNYQMQLRKHFILLIHLSIVILFFTSFYLVNSATISKELIDESTISNQLDFSPSSKVEMTEEYLIHPPIFINHEENFTNLGYPITGGGTELNPFVIDKINISDITFSQNLIEIVDVAVHFKITNCLLIGGKNGITLKNLDSNAQIINNSIENGNLNGIEVIDSVNLSIMSNNIYDMKDNANGMILAEGSYNNTIFNNSIRNNHGYSLLLNDTSNNTITNNSIGYSNNYAILLSSLSETNLVKWNDLIENNVNVSSQVKDDSINNNTLIYNHWDDWIDPDSDHNGIVDNPYIIEGSAGNADPFPLVDRNCPLLLQDTDPEINPSSTSESNPISNPGLMPNPDLMTPLIVMVGILSVILPAYYLLNRKETYHQKKDVTTNKDITKPSASVDDVSKYPTFRKSNYRGEISPPDFSFEKQDTLNSQPISFEKPESSIKSLFYITLLVPIFWFFSQILYPPMLRRLSIDKVLNNPIRQEILLILKEKEIVHYISLHKTLNCGVSILLWHLQVLEDFGLIKHYNIRRNNVYFLSKARITEFKINLFCSIRHPKTMLVAHSFLEDESSLWTKNSLVENTGLSYKAVSYHCNRLEELGLLSYLKDSRSYFLVSDHKSNLEWLLQQNRIKFQKRYTEPS